MISSFDIKIRFLRIKTIQHDHARNRSSWYIRTTEISGVPRPNETQGPSGLQPNVCSPLETVPKMIDLKRLAIIKTIKKKMKYVIDNRTKVHISRGMKALTRDMRLHLKKLQPLKTQCEAEVEDWNCSNEGFAIKTWNESS